MNIFFKYIYIYNFYNISVCVCVHLHVLHTNAFSLMETNITVYTKGLFKLHSNKGA